MFKARIFTIVNINSLNSDNPNAVIQVFPLVQKYLWERGSHKRILWERSSHAFPLHYTPGAEADFSTYERQQPEMPVTDGERRVRRTISSDDVVDQRH